MGNSPSASHDSQVSIAAINNLIMGTFTVLRTSGVEEDGWVIYGSPLDTVTSDHLVLDRKDLLTMRACKVTDDWKIFMHNNKADPNRYACGWRRLTTIYPTGLVGKQGQIDSWREGIKTILDGLEAQRREEREEAEFLKNHAKVISYKYELFGFYLVKDVGTGHLFEKKGNRFIGQGNNSVLVPYSEPMGVGDFESVTPEMIN